MPSPEKPFQIPANDNREKFPPESFDGLVQQLVYTSEFNRNGFFDQAMFDTLRKGEKPVYKTDTPEGLKKEHSFQLLKHLQQIMNDPDSLESERNEAYRMLFEFAKQGAKRIDED